MNNVIPYLVSFGATFLAAFAGSAASIQAGGFYQSLSKPTWAPPGFVFGPVWTGLYLLMAIAGGAAFHSAGWGKSAVPATVFGVQLALNALWSWTFFRFRSGGWAFVDIVLLLVAIVVNIVVFWRIRPLFGLLLTPYLAWVLFAAALNLAVWQMNPGKL